MAGYDAITATTVQFCPFFQSMFILRI